MRISDWSSDVCSSDLLVLEGQDITIVGIVDSLPDYTKRGVRFDFVVEKTLPPHGIAAAPAIPSRIALSWYSHPATGESQASLPPVHAGERWRLTVRLHRRSEEQTSEPQSLMRNSYAVFCL